MFCRKADHEIEFQRIPALIKDRPGRLDDLLFIDILVDDVSKSLSPGFRGHGDPGLPDPLDLLDQLWGECSDSHGWKGYRELLFAVLGHDCVQEDLDARIISKT